MLGLLQGLVIHNDKNTAQEAEVRRQPGLDVVTHKLLHSLLLEPSHLGPHPAHPGHSYSRGKPGNLHPPGARATSHHLLVTMALYPMTRGHHLGPLLLEGHQLLLSLLLLHLLLLLYHLHLLWRLWCLLHHSSLLHLRVHHLHPWVGRHVRRHGSWTSLHGLTARTNSICQHICQGDLCVCRLAHDHLLGLGNALLQGS